ncbi:MAG: hypothetical protein U0163_02755 [Gemmatimonadaceae bacterium]
MNKVALVQAAEFDIMYAEGISHIVAFVDTGSELESLQKPALGGYNGQRIGQGRENAKMFPRQRGDDGGDRG